MFVAGAVIALWTLPAVLVAPSSDIDANWQIGLQLALLQKLQFGKDIIFTLGPFSFLYTPLFIHPSRRKYLSSSPFLSISSCWRPWSFSRAESPPDGRA